MAVVKKFIEVGAAVNINSTPFIAGGGGKEESGTSVVEKKQQMKCSPALIVASGTNGLKAR